VDGRRKKKERRKKEVEGNLSQLGQSLFQDMPLVVEQSSHQRRSWFLL
jgi:hypothetical protein